MIKKEITVMESGEYSNRHHVKTVYKVFGIAIYIIKTATHP